MTDRPTSSEHHDADAPADNAARAGEQGTEVIGGEADARTGQQVSGAANVAAGPAETGARDMPSASESDPEADDGSEPLEQEYAAGGAPEPRPGEPARGPRTAENEAAARAYAQHGAVTADQAPDTKGPPAGAPMGGADVAEQPNWAELAERDPRSPAELLAELTEAEARRDEYLEDVRRARAEFENYRKRVMKEGTAQRTAGIVEVVTRLLDVVDDFDRTLEAAQQTEDEAFRKGVELVYGKLVDALRSLGLERIDAVGEPFDPNFHEAVQQVPADEDLEQPVVHQVLRPGYQLDGRVVRAAMVVVAQ